MPYSRYARRTRRTYRKRRGIIKSRISRRYRTRKYKKVETSYREAVKYRVPFKSADQADPTGMYPYQIQFSWMNSYNGAVANNTFSINNGNKSTEGTDQLVNLTNMFKYMKIYGLRLEYIPMATGDIDYSPIDCGTVAPTPFNVAPNIVMDYDKYWRNARDLRSFDPKRRFVRYYRVSKAHKYRTATPWLTCEAFATGQVQETPDFVTCVAGRTSKASYLVGYFDVTYYVKAKDRISEKTIING